MLWHTENKMKKQPREKGGREIDRMELKRLIDVAAGREAADLLITNAQVADVFQGIFRPADVALTQGTIAAVYDPAKQKPCPAKQTFNADEKYLLPAFIDGHMHVESSFVSPEELGNLLAVHGTGTIVSDPHEIVNVCGLAGLDWMLESAKNSPVDIKFMMPSCVPVTEFEDNGTAPLEAPQMEAPFKNSNLLGLGELMCFNAVAQGDEKTLDKIRLAQRLGKIIDGHAPGVRGAALQAYTAAGVRTDHECATIDEMNERLSLGMYVMLRNGSACKDLPNLIKGLTPSNSRRCLLCIDDLQSEDIMLYGHMDYLVRLAVSLGLPPMTAIQMATLNPSECYRLVDRGAIAPGRRADLVLVDDIKDFKVNKVWLGGKVILPVKKTKQTGRKDEAVTHTMHVCGFSQDTLQHALDACKPWVIGVKPGSIATEKIPWKDGMEGLNYIAVVERHHETGRLAAARVKGFALKHGALATSVSHDSHNIICTGVDAPEMAAAIQRIIALQGGVAVLRGGKVLAELPLPIAGLMSDRDGAFVAQRLAAIRQAAVEGLGLDPSFDPTLSLAFLSLIAVPELKITCRGLFDTAAWSFL
jgi:adenine deaminase